MFLLSLKYIKSRVHITIINLRIEKMHSVYICVYIYVHQWHPTPGLLPGKSHGRRSLVGYSPWGQEELDTTARLHFHFSLSCTGEGNDNPLQCSCLENPGDGGAWWAAVSGILQSGYDWSDLAAAFSYSGFPYSSVGKNLPAMQETPVWFLGQEDPLEKEQATHSSILGLPLWLSW